MNILILIRSVCITDKTLSKAQKLIKRIESAKQTSRVNAESIPSNATIRKEYVRCGKPGCEQEPHGTYYYAYWKERVKIEDNSDIMGTILKKKYIGNHFPNQIQ